MAKYSGRSLKTSPGEKARDATTRTAAPRARATTNGRRHVTYVGAVHGSAAVAGRPGVSCAIAPRVTVARESSVNSALAA